VRATTSTVTAAAAWAYLARGFPLEPVSAHMILSVEKASNSLMSRSFAPALSLTDAADLSNWLTHLRKYLQGGEHLQGYHGPVRATMLQRKRLYALVQYRFKLAEWAGTAADLVSGFEWAFVLRSGTDLAC
jgi:hypothetical protein